MKKSIAFASFAMAIWGLAGCERDNMWIQARPPRLGESAFFEDGRAAREPIAGTVAHGSYSDDSLLHEGMEAGKAAERFPFAVDAKVLDRGKERYGVFCAQCHGQLGDGVSILVQRGYQRIRPFTDPATLKKPIGELYQAFKKGVPKKIGPRPDLLSGTGYDLEDVVHPVLGRRLSAEDRWSVLAWVRVLQASQHFSAADLTAEERQGMPQQNAQRSQNGSR